MLIKYLLDFGLKENFRNDRYINVSGKIIPFFCSPSKPVPVGHVIGDYTTKVVAVNQLHFLD